MSVDQSSCESMVSLVERYVKLQKTSSVYRGGQWSGPCPFCNDGKDRFNVWADEKWWCRKCNRGGDRLAFVAEINGWDLKSRDGMRQAKAALGIDDDGSYTPSPRPKPKPAPPEPPPRPDSEPPLTAWQNNAWVVVERAQRLLWSPQGERALRYLVEERGLEAYVIKEARLGYVPGKPTEWNTTWLPLWKYTDGKVRRRTVPIPCGITIPHVSQGNLWGIRVRRSKVVIDELGHKYNSKYQAVPGWRKNLYWADQVAAGKPLMIVEGEFDALTAWQCFGELICPVALASTAYAHIESRWYPLLMSAPCIFVRMDAEPSGVRAAGWLQQMSSRVVNIQVPHGGDINGMFKEGGYRALWNWARQLLDDAGITIE